MSIIITRKLADGREVTVGVEDDRIVVRVAGKIHEPQGIAWGLVESISNLRGPQADALRKAGRTHLLQGNVGLDSDEADLVEVTKANIQSAARARLEAAVPGLPAYESAMRTYANAAHAYDVASERGYPVAEARALDLAEATLTAVHAAHPETVAWRKIEDYCNASHYAKNSAGTRARNAVKAGGDPIAAAAKMEAEWSAAAHGSMD